MLDQDKSKQELIEELAEMRRQVAVLTADTNRKQVEAGRTSRGRLWFRFVMGVADQRHGEDRQAAGIGAVLKVPLAAAAAYDSGA